MSSRVRPALIIAAALLLTGCAPVVAPEAAPSGSAAAETSTPTPTPTPVGELVIGIDEVTYEHAGATQEFPFMDDGEELLALVEELTGQLRQGEEIEGPYGGEWGTAYKWDEISIIVAGDQTRVSVAAPSVGGVPVVTPEGLSVGSGRNEVVAAGGRDGWDADEDGVADYMDLGEQQVPDTQSLSRPGEVGILFVTVELDDDVVVEIQAPANDFSDI